MRITKAMLQRAHSLTFERKNFKRKPDSARSSYLFAIAIA